MSNRTAKGSKAEQTACEYLQAQGLRLVTRNFRCPLGEIDLVMEDGQTLVFVEVRSRARTRFGHPLETVGWRKQRRISLTACWYLQGHATRRRCRFDVVTLDGPQQRLQWVKNAFMAHYSEL